MLPPASGNFIEDFNMDNATDDRRTNYANIDDPEECARAIHEGGDVFAADIADIVRAVASPRGGFFQQQIYHALFAEDPEQNSALDDQAGARRLTG